MKIYLYIVVLLIVIIITSSAVSAKHGVEFMSAHRFHQQRQLRALSPFDIFLDPCTLINEQFAGDVLCTCSGSLVTTLEFTCPFTESVCLQDFCGTPTYSGQLSIFGLTSVNEICLSDLDGPGLLPLGDLCLEVNFDPRNGDSVLTCQASWADFACLSCTPCVDGNGEFGIELGGCDDSLPSGDCTVLPGLLSAIRDDDNAVLPFIPNLTFLKDMIAN